MSEAGSGDPSPAPTVTGPDAGASLFDQPWLAAGVARWRRAVSRFGARVNSMSYVPKWLILGTLIGIIAGLGAVVFYEMLTQATRLFLAVIAGYHIPTPAGEGFAAGSSHYVRAWIIPIVVVVGGLLSGFLVFTWAPEAEGHGTDAAIRAVNHNPRQIRLRAVVVKIVASALTIGSGGSGGREGPTAQISAGFGSLLARLFDLTPEDGRIAVSIGIGSGIGAIFSAPLGGAVLAADVVYREDFEFSALLPGMFASIISYSIFGAFFGYQPLFAGAGHYQFHEPIQLLWFAIIGVFAGGIGLLYSKCFYGVVRLSSFLPFSRKLRPAAGALLVGLLALWMPEVLGTGYGWVQKGLSNELLHVPLYLILLLPFARIVATSLSIGTGGSGGVFGPGMVIGSFTGLAVWRILEPIAPGVGHSPAPFVVVGMMAVFGGISRAPIAVMLMVAEMTGSISILGPAMAAIAIAWFIVRIGDDSIYRSQARTRADSTVGRLRVGLPLLHSLRVASVVNEPRVVVDRRLSAGEALRALQKADVPGAPVVDGQRTYLGTVSTERLDEVLEANAHAPLSAALDNTATAVAMSASLDVGLEALTQAGCQWVTVTNGARRVVGILSVGDLVRGYGAVLGASIAQVAQLPAQAVAVEEPVGRGSPLVGRRISEVDLPAGCVIVTVQHGERQLLALGTTEIAVGDVLSVVATHDSATAMRALISGRSS